MWMEQGGSWFQTQLTDFCAHLSTVQHVDNVVDDDDNDDNDIIKYHGSWMENTF